MYDKTYEGANTVILTPEQQLRRSVLSCMLWEDTFYENGISIAQRIMGIIPSVDAEVVANLAIEAREKFKLRSVPLLLVKTLAELQRGTNLVSKVLSRVIQRPDEITKFVEMYWENGKKPLSAQIKKGLQASFDKFDEYQLAKWNRDHDVKLRDVMLLTHPKPKNEFQAELWRKLLYNELKTPDTWEVRLSSGADKKQSWEELLTHNKMGALAILKNIHNFQIANVDNDIVVQALREVKTERVLPFRFLTASKYTDNQEIFTALENAMFKCIDTKERILGKTVILVDVSGSMDWPTEQKYVPRRWATTVDHDKTQPTRIDYAAGLAILLREICEHVKIYTFSSNTVEVEPRRGFALKDVINNSQQHSSTYLGAALTKINDIEKYDRLVVFTDEQSHDNVHLDDNEKTYIVNVAPYQHSVGYGQNVIHIDGFSEAVIDWIIEYENASSRGWKSTIEQILFSEF